MTDKMARTVRVAAVTDDVIQHLADEAETGYDSGALCRLSAPRADGRRGWLVPSRDEVVKPEGGWV